MLYQNENFGGKLEFRSRRHDRFDVPMHLHEYSELLYAQRGNAEVYTAAGLIELPEKHLLFLPPNQLHEYRCRTQVICAVFFNDLIPLFHQQLAGKSLVPRPICMEKEAAWLETLPDMDPADVLRISGYLNLICARVLEESEPVPAAPTDSVLYQKVLSYVSQHFAEDLTLGDLARRFGYNEKYLSHSLHGLTGMNFRHLLCSYRVEAARRLLAEEPAMSIAEIAMRSGFSALNTFNRVFKEMTGQRPSEYRASVRP